MNLLYMKYALEVAACGSINKAAEKLYIDQPNLSRAIRDLESSLGVLLFERSPKGMKLTPAGQKFIEYANSILDQVDTMESMFRKGIRQKKHFSVSVPRAAYISEAFLAFSRSFAGGEKIEAIYEEASAAGTIKNILQENYKLGIVRYPLQNDRFYKDMLEEKGLDYELVVAFRPVLILSEKSPLATAERVQLSDLTDRVEIACADPCVSSPAVAEAKKAEDTEGKQHIFLSDSALQFTLLSEHPEAFMWGSPLPEQWLSRYGLMQHSCEDNTAAYKDVIVYRKDYKLSTLDRAFISELCRVKREVFGNPHSGQSVLS